MEKNYSSLLSLICEVRLDYRRVNDLAIANEELTIQFYDTKNAAGVSETRLCLRDSKKNEYALSIKQLAGLRVQTGTITATWLDEFKSDAAGAVFQTRAKEIVESGKSLENLKFKVVKQLKVKNNQITDKLIPVYKDYCYEGAQEYTRGIRALLANKGSDFFQTAEYARGMAELREKLHSSPIKQGQAIEANLVLLPVFEVI